MTTMIIRRFLSFLSVALVAWGGLSVSSSAAIVVGFTLEAGDYHDDFQGTSFPDGWQYLWNQPNGWAVGGPSVDGTTNPIENGFAGFAPLIWGGSNWTADGDGTGTNNQPGGFGRLNATSGHPALGSGQTGSVGNTQDRYMIAAYTVTQGGEYEIADSFIQRTSGTSAGTVDARVFVNSGSNEITPATISEGLGTGTPMAVSFDRSLNTLAAGDTVYVAAGPDGDAGNDTFLWDFTVQQTRFDVRGDQTQSNTDIRLIQEQTLTLASDLTVDRANPYGLSGTFGPNAGAGNQTIAAGTEITSYLLHFDPVTAGTTANGIYTFDQEIVGLVFVPAKLDATDTLLGLSSIIYPTDPGAQTTQHRGALNEATDQLIISADRRTIDLTMFAGGNGSIDQIRILTAQAVPEPGGMALFAMAAAALGVCWRMRRTATASALTTRKE